MRRDLASHISRVAAFGPAALGADQNAVEIDLQGFNAAVIEIDVGVGGITFDADNRIEFIARHKDDGESYASVGAGDLNGKDKPASVSNGVIKVLDEAHPAVARYEIGYIGGKRFLELDIEFVGTHGTPTPVSVTVAKGHPALAPAD